MMFEHNKSKFLVEALPDSDKNLRTFGIGTSIILSVIWLIGIFIFARQTSYYLPIFAVFFLLTGLFFHSLIRPVYNTWMYVAIRIGHFVTFLILFIMFSFVFTPIGLFRRMLGTDTLGLKFDRTKNTHWKDKESIIDRSRYLKEF